MKLIKVLKNPKNDIAHFWDLFSILILKVFLAYIFSPGKMFQDVGSSIYFTHFR